MDKLLGISIVITLMFGLGVISQSQEIAMRNFSIDYNKNTFVKDGQPFRYISGSMHYGRVHHLYWKDRLSKMYMAGLDAVQTYVLWNLHEPVPATFNFKDNADIENFLQIANDTGLLVILRAGPYICGEWDMGGLPSWLLRYPDIQLRTSDTIYLKYVDLWMAVLLPKIKPYLYANGGPIISVQVENEYGSYQACDNTYMQHLLFLFSSYLGNNVVYFTTDGAADHFLKCGTVSGAYPTVDFGSGSNVSASFEQQRKYAPQGPLVNSEYYTGWLDHWGEKHQTVSSEAVVKSLDDMLKLGANVNMYMFEGGTNFAFWNGANGNSASYSPQPTSYDYDAPLTEAGDPNDKYTAIRNLIQNYKTLPPGQVPPATPKHAYGQVTADMQLTFYEALDLLSPSGPVLSVLPLSMEDMRQNFGFLLYRTRIPVNISSPTPLYVRHINDRGYVMVNTKPMGILYRNTNLVVNITGQANMTLDILVENMGHLNYGCCINDSKGILGNVTLGGTVLTSWEMYSLNLTQISTLTNHSLLKTSLLLGKSAVRSASPNVHTAEPLQVPGFSMFKLPAGPATGPQDTFLKMSGWTKGQAFMNGFNLGRYWPTEGPQITLYVPAVVMTTDMNLLIVFETEAAPSPPMVEFINYPIINGSVHPGINEEATYLGERAAADLHMRGLTLTTL